MKLKFHASPFIYFFHQNYNLGRCKITVKILDEPMMCTKVNITVKIEGLIGGKTLHR